MADFSKYTNWTPETSFSKVVFGKDSPLLEVEVNELQEIFQNKLKKITTAIGDCAIVDSNFFSFDSEVSGNNVAVTGYNLNGGELFTSDGKFVTIPTYHKTGLRFLYSISMDSKEYVYAYVFKEEEAKYDTTLYEDGFVDSLSGTPTTPQIANPIKDARYDNETSRRKVVKVMVSWGLSIPASTENYSVVLLGTITKDAGATTFVFTPASNALENARNAAIQSLINKENIDNIDSQVGRAICYLTVGIDPWSSSRYEPSDVYCDYYKLNGGTIEKVVGVGVPIFNTSSAQLIDKLTVYKETGWETHQSQWTDLDHYEPVILFSKGSYSLVLKHGLTAGEKYQLDYRINFNLGKIDDTEGFQEEYGSFDSFKAISGTLYFDTDMPTVSQMVDYTEIEIPFTFLHYKTMGSLFYVSAMGVTFYKYVLRKYNSTRQSWDYVENIDSPVKCVYIKHLEAKIHRLGIDKVTRPSVNFGLITQDYNGLSNKPQINAVTLSGNKTSSDLHIEGGGGTPMTNQEIDDICDDILGGNT